MGLKKLLLNNDLTFIMEAHDALTAKIVESTGFECIWASGLSIASSLGLRDENEASWSQILQVLEFMSDATNIPILVDGDNGFGNFNNARIFAKKLYSRGISSVCFEDKTFPKRNSFIGSYDIQENPLVFAGKIKACKDAIGNDDFTIIARIESFIFNKPLEDALERAEIYTEAGADALVVHSKKSDASEIEKFMASWKYNTPIIIIPTKYPKTTIKTLKEMNISGVIWANHNLRAVMRASQEICKLIYERKSIDNLDDYLIPLEEVFNYLDYSTLKIEDEIYSKNLRK